MKLRIEKSLETLEFPKVIETASEFALSNLGKEKFKKLSPSSNYDEIIRRQEETDDSAHLLRLKGGLPVATFEDVRPHIKRMSIGASLNGEEISQIGRIIKNIHEMKNFFTDLKEEKVQMTQLYKISESFILMKQLERTIFSTIDEGGYVVDEASSKLRGIRTGIKETEGRAREKLENIVRGGQSRYLTEAIITMRNDRYVIPVKAENRHTFGGVVHDQSSTGQTLFIEPQSVVDLNNQLRQYQSEERYEIERILSDLTNEIAPYTDDLQHNLSQLVELDYINAKARYGNSINAVRPIVSQEKKVELIEARHPLIEEESIVENDIILGEDFQTVIVTGPNTGGKTVVLKTLGLLQLMGQAGLQLPVAEESTMGVFSNVFADIGDEQSIEQSLSTFSSHMTNIVNIFEEIDQNSLVLLDELGAGTDPQEGAALAIAMLDEIAAVGSYVMITSHYPELKAYGYNRPKTVNASMEFDVESLKPTYRLLIGIPGRSNAFEIARRLRLNDSIISSARQLMSGESQSVDQMIQDLEDKRKQAGEESKRLTKELREAEKLHRELKEAFEDYQNSQEELEKKAQNEANKIVDKAQKEADDIISDLRERQLEGETGQNIKEHEFIDAKTSLSGLKHEEEQLQKNKVLRKEKQKKVLEPGDDVQVQSFGQQGTIIEKADKSQWVVQMGMLKMKLDEEDLLPIKQESAEPTRQTRVSASVGSISTEIDLRGERVESALNQLDQYLDQALLANYPKVTVIHGMGTGAVRKAVKEALAKHPQVKSYNDAPANQGGNGATIVQFN